MSIPIAFGAGIAFYFAAAREPVAWVTAITAAALCTAAFLLRRRKAFPFAVMAAALAAGFATATLKTARVAHGRIGAVFSVAVAKPRGPCGRRRTKGDAFRRRTEKTGPCEAPPP